MDLGETDHGVNLVNIELSGVNKYSNWYAKKVGAYDGDCAGTLAYKKAEN